MTDSNSVRSGIPDILVTEVFFVSSELSWFETVSKLMEDSNRIVFADYLRVTACFLVMLVHASENFYAADASGLAGNVSMLANEANRFWVAFYDGFVARTCVPLFMIISAFLLVPMKPGVTMLQFYKRRFRRVLPPMLCFTM